MNLFQFLRNLSHPPPPSYSSTPSNKPQIIIGAGPAGLALSTRLSILLPTTCILLLEAGPDGRTNERIYTPGLRGTTFNTPLDWSLPTVPMVGANNRSIIHNRGKVLGGSSALNLLVWDRASKSEYDVWEKLGNEGWNWENMYEAMLGAENFQRPRANATAQYGVEGVGYGGPVQVGLLEDPVPEHLKAGPMTMQNLGVKTNLESLGGEVLGTMFQPAMQRFSNHTRSYAVDYLPIAGGNLVVRCNSTVEKVLLDQTSAPPKALGVLLTDGTRITATKEVILSAGSLLSPRILELSGIGQKSILKEAKINQIVNLPGVGENLQDHLRIQTTYELKPSILGLDILKYNTTRAAIELSNYRQNKTSLYQYAGSGYAFIRWSQALSPNSSTALHDLAVSSANTSNPIDNAKLTLLTALNGSAPDVEIVFSDGYIGTRGYPSNTTTGYAKQYVSLIAGVMHPLARGNVHINTSFPLANPVINPRFLSNAYDTQALIHAAKYTRKISQTPPFSDVWVKEYDPGNTVQTEHEWEKYVRDNVYTFYHPLGSCAMLPREEEGVVDKELKVYGVKGLRVVDASVIPVIISAHIQTAVYGIAERAARMVAREWEGK